MQQYYCHLLVLICLEYSWIVIHAFGKTTSFGSTNKPTIIGKLLQILNFWSPKKSTYDNEKHLRSKTVILTTQRYQKKNCRDFKYSCFTFNLIRQTVLDISCKNVEVVEFFLAKSSCFFSSVYYYLSLSERFLLNSRFYGEAIFGKESVALQTRQLSQFLG